MAFLDNSGDIILDAVLTELGRQRMAEDTNFSVIKKFALGDDEIQYGTYDLSHPSGSAYYDLEIMQTPIFEATTAINSNIDYGLLKITDTSLLYLPVLALNEKTKISSSRYTNMMYLMVNQETYDAAKTTVSALETSMIQGDNSTPFVVFESGLDTYELAADQTNRSDYIVANGMDDTTFTVHADSRFVSRVGGVRSDNHFRNTSDNQLKENLSLAYTTTTGRATGLDNYSSYTVVGITNGITEPTTGNDNDLSAIKGPRGTVGGLNFSVPSALASAMAGTTAREYTQYGTTNTAVLGGSTYFFDYIDTTVYITGDKSSATMQLPLRILRLTRQA
ncbi:MAG: hypothetical protein CML56_00125 [Rhodobacteraceae bacterium]|nr:hypothetical protein [Paracoccaceae bacterium]